MTDDVTPYMPGAGALILNALRADEREEHRAKIAALAAAWANEEPEQLAIGDDILQGEPPPDLPVDAAELPPQRVRLLRYYAWLASLRNGLTSMQEGRADFLRQLGAPAVTEAELQKTLEGDKRGLLSWMLGGGRKAGTDMPPIRVFERQRLEEKLTEDTHLAEVAKPALDEIEARIALRVREITALEGREHEFLHDALLEIAAAEFAEPYKAQIAALQDTVRSLLGLAEVMRGRAGFTYGAGPHTANVVLPRFGLPGLPGHRGENYEPGAPSRPELVVSAEEAAGAARSWRALAALLRNDPRASQAQVAAVVLHEQAAQTHSDDEQQESR